LTFNGGELRAIEVMNPVSLQRSNTGWSLTLRLIQNGMHVHNVDGTTLETLTLRGPGAINRRAPMAGTAVLAVRDDFAPVWKALNVLMSEDKSAALSEQPFRRAVALPALLAHLGVTPGSWCCVDTHGMPPPLDDRTVTSAQR